MTTQTKTHLDWNIFAGREIPSSLETYPVLYEMISQYSNAKIADCGCGFGKTCFEMVINVPDADIVGFDINAGGIEDANSDYLKLVESYSDTKVAQCSFVVEDATDLSFDDNSFDVIVMQAFMTTLTSPAIRKKALAEARRILKPGGSLYMAVFMQTWHNPIMYDKYMAGHDDSGELGSFFARDKKTGEFQYQAHHYSERELVELLKGAGFAIERFNYETFTTRSGKKVNGGVIWAK